MNTRNSTGWLAVVLLALIAGLVTHSALRGGEAPEELRAPEVTAGPTPAERERVRDEPTPVVPEPGRRAASCELRVVSDRRQALVAGGVVVAGEDGAQVPNLARTSPMTWAVDGPGVATLRFADWPGHYDQELECRWSDDAPVVVVELQSHIELPVRFLGGLTGVLSEVPPWVGVSREAPRADALWTKASLGTFKRSEGLRLGPATLTLLEPPPVFATLCGDGWPLETVAVSGKESALVFDLRSIGARSAATLELCVLDAQTLRPPEPGRYGGVHVRRSPAPVRGIPQELDDRGCVSLSHVGPGRQHIIVRLEGYADAYVVLDVPPGAVTVPETILIEPVAQIIGSFLDGDGDVLEVEVVHVDPVSGLERARSRYMEDYMGGHFAFDFLEAGEVLLSARGRGVALNPVRVRLETGLQYRRELKAQPGIGLVLRGAAGGTRAARIVTAEGEVIWGETLGAGVARNLWLLPGEYTLQSRAAHSRGEWAAQGLRLVDGAPRTLTLAGEPN